jgi:heme-degrading monooxygenase HmoA
MFVILWEYEVKPGSETRFQRVYGPRGAWVRLFRRDPHFRGTRLLRDPARPRVYFTIDFWDSATAYRRFLTKNRAWYRKIDRETQGLTRRERPLFSLTQAEALSPASNKQSD